MPATASSSECAATSLSETAMRSDVDKCYDALHPFAIASALVGFRRSCHSMPETARGAAAAEPRRLSSLEASLLPIRGSLTCGGSRAGLA